MAKAEELNSYISTLQTIMANPRMRNAAKFVVTCPRGHPMGRVYVVKSKAVFVSLTRLDGTNRGGEAASRGRHPSKQWDRLAARETEQAVEYFDFIYDHDFPTVPAQCVCSNQFISRQWLLDRLGEGNHGAVWRGWKWYVESAGGTFHAGSLREIEAELRAARP